MKLTPTRIAVLEHAAKPRMRMFGPHPKYGTTPGAVRWGWVGGGDGPRLNSRTVDALWDAGLIALISDSYPLGYYKITRKGRAALSGDGGEGGV